MSLLATTGRLMGMGIGGAEEGGMLESEARIGGEEERRHARIAEGRSAVLNRNRLRGGRHKSMDQKGPEQLDSGSAPARTRCALFSIPCAVYWIGVARCALFSL